MANFRKIFFLFCLQAAAYVSFAQPQDLQYGNFLQKDTSIRWAGIYNSVLDLTPVNPNYDINKFYQRKLKNKGIAIYQEDSSLFSVKIMEKRYADYIKTIQPVSYDEWKMNWKYNFSEGNDVHEWLFNKEENKCDTCFFNNRLSLVEAKQLLYYKNHRLYIRNILLKPVLYKKSTDESKEAAAYYSGAAVAFDDITDDGSIPVSATFIARTSNILNFAVYLNSYERRSVTTHQYSLFRELFNDVKKGWLKAFDTDQSLTPPYKYIRKDTLEDYHNPLIEIVLFDDNGNEAGTRLVKSEFNLDSVYAYSLVQDLYFDFTREKLYSKVISVIPMIKVVTGAGLDLGMAYYWGINFAADKPKKQVLKK